MRTGLIAAALVVAAGAAQAADMPDLPILRGSLWDRPVGTGPIWEGFYVGGQAGHSSADMVFDGATRQMISQMMINTVVENEFRVSQWPVLGKASQEAKTFGVFAGYNSQWEDVVVGLEANYVRSKFSGASSGGMGRSKQVGDYLYNVSSASAASVDLKDFGSLRIRGGYTVGSFMPYAFAGLGIGYGDVTRQARVDSFAQYTGTAGLPNIGPNTTQDRQVERDKLMYGYTAGVGVDVLLVGGLFARAEYEYLRITSNIGTSINTVRAGLGYRF